MTPFKVIGQLTARVEGPDKVTGTAKYGIDALLPGTLWCKVLRSPHPHARIVSVDASKDLPQLTTVVLNSSTGHGPYNVRGVGNASIALPAPAIANTIADACGSRVRDLPITAEKVLRNLTSTPR
jgi:CO/xanthine dehydrogenase Mo-binding subunit